MNKNTLKKYINGLIAIEASSIQTSKGDYYRGITSNIQDQFNTLSSSIYYYETHSNINNYYTQNYGISNELVAINNSINNNYNFLQQEILSISGYVYNFSSNIITNNTINNNYNYNLYQTLSGEITNINNKLIVNNNMNNNYYLSLSSAIDKINITNNNQIITNNNNYNTISSNIYYLSQNFYNICQSLSGQVVINNYVTKYCNSLSGSIFNITQSNNGNFNSISGFLVDIRKSIDINYQSISSIIINKYNLYQGFNLVPINQSISINDLYNIQNTKANIAFSINDIYDTLEIIDNRQRSGIKAINDQLLISNVTRGVFSAASIALSIMNGRIIAALQAQIGILQFELFTLTESISAMSFNMQKMTLDTNNIHRRTRNLDGSSFNSYLQVGGDLYVGTRTVTHSKVYILGELQCDEEAKFNKNVQINSDLNVDGRYYNSNGNLLNGKFEDLEI